MKDGSDRDRRRVDADPLATAIAALQRRPKPFAYPADQRIAPTELHVYTVRAYLVGFELMPDGDVHLRLEDVAGRHLIAEMPYRRCVSTRSRWRAQMLAARRSFTSWFVPTTAWQDADQFVEVQGLGYMDPSPMPGASPNGVELHPVTGFKLVAPSVAVGTAPYLPLRPSRHVDLRVGVGTFAAVGVLAVDFLAWAAFLGPSRRRR